MKLKAPDLFTTIRSEGGLLPPDLLQRVAEGDSDLKGLKPTDYHLATGERINEAVNRSWNRLVGAWIVGAQAYELYLSQVLTPPDLIEATLFGAGGGGPGALLQAQGGTLLLEGIGFQVAPVKHRGRRLHHTVVHDDRNIQSFECAHGG